MTKIFVSNTEKDFWDKVIIPNDIGECFVWNGSIGSKGYGQFCMNYKNTTAHRWAYIFTYGSIDDNLEGDHLCKNKLCVNPMHIEVVSHAVNNRRSNSASAKNYGKTHCKYGHEFTEANTRRYTWKGIEKRACRTCGKTLKTSQELVT